MTDAVFSFGTDASPVVDGIISDLARLEEALARAKDASGAPISTLAFAEGLPTTIDEVAQLAARLNAARGELVAAREDAQTFSDAFRIDSAVAQIDNVTKALVEQTAALDKSAAAARDYSAAGTPNPALITQIIDKTDALDGEAAAYLRTAEAARASAAASTEAAAAAKEASNSTFAGGLSRGSLRNGSTLSSNLGYTVARQAENLGSLGVQLATFDAGYQAIGQVKEYQKGVQDLNIAMQSTAPQQYLNTLADLSRTVGENAAEAFDSAASGIRAFQNTLQAIQGYAPTAQQKQEIGLAVTQNATQLGVIGGEGQNKATDQIVAIGTAYGLQASELTQVTDAIAATKRFAGGEPNEIAAGLARFAVSGNAAGLDLNGAAALIGRIQSTTGESGDSIANSVSRILETVGGTHGDKIAAQYANDGNVSSSDRRTLANANSTEWQRLQAFSDIFRNGDVGTQDNILSAIGGTRNRAEATTLLTQMPLIQQFNQAFNGSGPQGAAGQGLQQFTQQMNTVEGTIKRIEGDLRNIAADLGNSGLFDLFGSLAKAADPLLQSLDNVLRLLGEINKLGDAHGVGVLAGAGEIALAAKGVSLLRGGGDGKGVAATDANTVALDRLTAAIEGNTVAEEESAATGGRFSAKGFGLGLGLTAAGGFLQNGRPGSFQNNAGDVLSLAGTGATIGSFLGPEGTAAGGLIGGIIGAAQAIGQTNAQNKANQNYYDSATAAARQDIAAGKFAEAVKEFESAAANLAKVGDTHHAEDLRNTGEGLRSALNNPVAAWLAEQSADPRSGAKPADMALAGRQAIAQALNLENATGTHPETSPLYGGSLVDIIAKQLGIKPNSTAPGGGLRQWRTSDVANTIFGSLGSGTVGQSLAAYRRLQSAHDSQIESDRANNPYADTGGSFDTDALNSINARISSLQSGRGAKAMLQAAVEKAVKEYGLAQTKELSDGQITSIVKNALPGLTQDQINGLIPQVQQALAAMAGKDGIGGGIQGLANLETAAAPQMVATLDQIRKALIKKASSRAEFERINAEYGKLEVAAAGDDSALIAKVFKNLDSQTIATIKAAANEAYTAAENAVKMDGDIKGALSAAVGAIGQDLGSIGGLINLAADPGSVIGNFQKGAKGIIAENQLKQAKATLNALSDASSAAGPAVSVPKFGGGGSGAAHQYDYVKSAVAEARAARAGGGDIAAAMAAIKSAQDELDHNAKNTAAWWRADASLWQAKKQLAAAEVAHASTLFLLEHDSTNPVVQAEDKVLEAQKQLTLDRRLKFSPEVISKDKLALVEAEAAQQRAVFDQELSNIQTRQQLGQISQAAYIRWLKSEETSLENIKNKTQQQKDELNQVALALQQANDSMNAQFNLTSIDARGLIYQVQALSQIGAASKTSIPGAGIVNNNSGNTTINITSALTEAQLERLISREIARQRKTSPTVTTRPRRP